MKKLSLLLMAVAFFCPKETNAQDGKGSINFVPYVGMNYSDFSGDTQDYFGGTSGKVNFMAGARFEFQIAKKSAFIADINYRRLGATADNYAEFIQNTPYLSGNFYAKGPNDYYANKYRQIIMDRGGIIADFKKVTLDCISVGPRFKQGITDGLSVMVGVECSIVLSAKWHFHEIDNYGKPKNYPVEGVIIRIPDSEEFNRDDYEWIYTEGDNSRDIGDLFENVNLAIPLGLTYDYKNFSVNATYHLPLTKCASGSDNWGDYSLRNQSFDFTIGYRLPLRKR